MNYWTTESARIAFLEGWLQKWIEDYLQVPEWANPGLLRRVREFSIQWPEPELVSISCFDLIAGPSEAFMFPKHPADWEKSVDVIAAKGIDLETLPPLIGWVKEEGRLNLADGNHRVAAVKRLGIEKLWALIHPTPLG